jgi:hypothetical protein
MVREPGTVATLEFRARDSLGWILGMQVERPPLDLRAEPALKPRRPLEADVTERSYVIAPDEEDR